MGDPESPPGPALPFVPSPRGVPPPASPPSPAFGSAVTFDNFVLLNHRVGDKSRTLSDLHVALGFDPASKDEVIQASIADAIKNGPANTKDAVMARTAFAVLDLTGLKDKGATRYAG